MTELAKVLIIRGCFSKIILRRLKFKHTTAAAAAAAKSLQSCPTLCDPRDGSPPGFPFSGILQARTRVDCHFLLQCMKVKSESEVAQSCSTLSDPTDCSPPGSSRPWDFPGKSTGVGYHCALCQGHKPRHCIFIHKDQRDTQTQARGKQRHPVAGQLHTRWAVHTECARCGSLQRLTSAFVFPSLPTL